MEYSGLPVDSITITYKKLKAVHQKVVDLLSGTEVCRDGYAVFQGKHPVLKLTGLLFYDKEHEGNIPVHAAYKPASVWELHPISTFVWLK